MFAIIAELPLGVYRGNGHDGSPERLPSVARLYSALLSAAGFGPRAVPGAGDTYSPCEADEVALRWLEDNPPDSIDIPSLHAARMVEGADTIAFRDDGTLRKSKGDFTIKKLPKPPTTGYAVSGRFVWAWSDDPPPLVAAAFEALCPDVPYMGTSESPVRMRVATGDVETNLVRDPEAGVFSVGGTSVRRPLPGRLSELTAAHRAAAVQPSARSDHFGTDEKSLAAVPPCRAVEDVRYRAREAAPTNAPWSQAALIPVNRKIEAIDRVRWAVRVHKALISIIQDGVPPLITGVYPPGVAKPANRVALHFLDPELPVRDGGVREGKGTLAVLVPRGADDADVEALYAAVGELRSLQGPGGPALRLDLAAMQVLTGHEFWEPPGSGVVRTWRAVPAAVPDTRGSQSPGWTFAHAALLSVAFAFRDRLPTASGRGEPRYRRMAAEASARGAVVLSADPVRTNDVGRFAHTVHANAVVRPYDVRLVLGELAGDSTVAAIGQSRHLGGGLLVPVDLPRSGEVSERWG